MEDFTAGESDPEVDWDGKFIRLSTLVPMLHREFVSRRVPPFEADDLVGILLERIWDERLARARRGAPGGLRLTAGDIKRLAWSLLQARLRTAACDGVVDPLLRGERVLSSIGSEGADPDWFPDPGPGPDVLAEAADAKAALLREVRRAPREFPSTRDRAREMLDNAPHPPPRHGRDRTLLARKLLRNVYTALFGAPPQKKLAKRHMEER